MRAGLYARVSTTDQTAENQVIELRRYAELRGWTVAEYIDNGISGTKGSAGLRSTVSCSMRAAAASTC